MKVRMLETAPGAPDGLHVHQYEAGQEYDENSRPVMSDSLADVLIRGGLAAEVKAGAKPAKEPRQQAKAAPPEVQAGSGAPETQAATPAPSAE